VRLDRQRRIVGELLDLHASGATQLAEHVLRVDAATYVDPALFAREQRVFRRHPALVALAGDVAGPGDHVAVVVGGVPVAVVRGDDGVLRGFVNICRHRASPVVEGSGRGARRLRCGFHGWLYGLDGALQATPNGEDGFAELDPSCSGLTPLPVAEAHGLVWVRAEGDEAIDPDELLCGMGEEVGEFGFGSYHRDRSWVSEWDCNWKLLVDTFLETYHVPVLHATTVARWFLVRPSAFAPFGPNLRFHSLQKSLLGLRDRPEDEWELLPHGTVEYVLAPGGILSHSVDHVAFYRFVASAVDHTRVELTTYTPEPVADDAGREHYDRTIDLHVRVSGGEDFTQQVKLQRSLASGRHLGSVFGRNEPAAIHFHQTMRALCDAHGGAPR